MYVPSLSYVFSATSVNSPASSLQCTSNYEQEQYVPFLYPFRDTDANAVFKFDYLRMTWVRRTFLNSSHPSFCLADLFLCIVQRKRCRRSTLLLSSGSSRCSSVVSTRPTYVAVAPILISPETRLKDGAPHTKQDKTDEK
jgi:hypothetical protein